MFNRILVGLKFGPAGESALLKAAELARAHGSSLHIFHALDYLLQEPQNEEQLRRLQAETRERFERSCRMLVSGIDEVLFECEPADPALEICRRAKTRQVDLIILGCHQIPEKMCLGRIDYTGMTILEKAPCPVMLVPLCD